MTQFKCGTPLPGTGAYTLPDFDIGDIVDSGNGNNSDEEDDTPPWSGSGDPGRPSIPGPATPRTPTTPSTPGPSGPSAPGAGPTRGPTAAPVGPATPGPAGPAAPGAGPAGPPQSGGTVTTDGPTTPGTTTWWKCVNGTCRGVGFTNAQILANRHLIAGYTNRSRAECEKFCGGPTTPGPGQVGPAAPLPNPATPTTTGGIGGTGGNGGTGGTGGTGGATGPTSLGGVLINTTNGITEIRPTGGNGGNGGATGPTSLGGVLINTTNGVVEIPPVVGGNGGNGGTGGTGGTEGTGFTPFDGRVQVSPEGEVKYENVERVSIDQYISAGINNNVLDLNDPSFTIGVLAQYPQGFEDPKISLRLQNIVTKIEKNSTGYSELLKPEIDQHIQYSLKNNDVLVDWTQNRVAGITKEAIYSSLRDDVLDTIKQIRNIDNTPLTEKQIYSLVSNRILNGTLGELKYSYLKDIKERYKKDELEIKKSRDLRVNEFAAIRLLENFRFPLDPSKSSNKMAKILPNWKVFATDIDKYIPILIDGEYKRYYIQDDDSFIDRSSLKVLDGDYYKLYYNGETYKISCGSEIDHAFLVPEKEKQQIINLLGGSGERTISVSSLFSENIEFDYSLTSPRQNFYIFSANLSTLKTEPSLQNTSYLKDTTLTYSLIDTTTSEGLGAANEYIKYKANHRVFMVDDDDRILDYIETTGNLQVKQTDIIISASKENKEIPIYIRQVPWYIIVYPTNRHDYNIFNSKSVITTLEPSGIVVRQLKTSPTIAKDFVQKNQESFVQYRNTYKNDVTTSRGASDPYGYYSFVASGDPVYQKAYRVNDSIGSATQKKPTRTKTSFRLVKEIIEELDTNYIVELNGIGKSVTFFDVFSRLKLKEFYSLIKLENFNTLIRRISDGLIREVKVTSPIIESNTSLRKYNTQLIKKKAAAPEDIFTPIKTTADKVFLVPPTNTQPPSTSRTR